MKAHLPDFSQAKRLSRRLRSQAKLCVPMWPNGLGDAPADAIGKTITMKEFGIVRTFMVKAVNGDDLILNEVSA